MQERTGEPRMQTRRAEEERDRLMTLIESMAEGVWVSDADGQVVLTNAVAREQAVQLGLDPDDLGHVPSMRFEMFTIDGKPLNTELLKLASGREGLRGLEIMVRSIKTGEEL